MKVLSENQSLLTKYLFAAGCTLVETMLIVGTLWEEEATINMMKYLYETKETEYEILYDKACEIAKDVERSLTDEERKWRKMWSMWLDEKIKTPYAELMTYYDAVDNGGHFQYFENIRVKKHIKKNISTLSKIMSVELIENLKNAYNTFLVSEQIDEESFKEYDNIFFENVEEIICILEDFSLNIEL